ncbi:MAG: Capsular polysaccharide synthesis enzyme CapA [uncultured bacterium]|nr:MAG: Capsular polysaccharide synthesis enzyme CapA [uncultured bacterium]
MNKNIYLNIMRKQWKFILSVVIVMTLASFVFSIVQMPKYKSSTELLVIQENRADMDSYTAAKSSEQIANTLKEVIYTGSFMQRVFEEGENVKDDFGVDAMERRRKWVKTIDVSTVSNTGFLKIDVYNKDRGQSWLLATAIADILNKNSSDYHGGGRRIQVNVVDPPTLFDKVAKPDIVRNVSVGTILGLIAAVVLSFIFQDQKDLINIFDIISRKKNQNGAPEDIEIWDRLSDNVDPDYLHEKFEKEYKKSTVEEESDSLPTGDEQEQDKKNSVQEKEEPSIDDRSSNWLATGQLVK